MIFDRRWNTINGILRLCSINWALSLSFRNIFFNQLNKWISKIQVNSEDESHEQLIILVSGIFGSISCIMSILATSTSGWQINSYFNKTGLFRTCYKDSCTDISYKHDIPIGFAIVGQCLIGLAVIGSFVSTFISRRRIGLIIITVFFFSCFLIFLDNNFNDKFEFISKWW